MVVLQPIKPGPPRVSLSLKRGRGARRALSLLGNNDSRQNLQLAESLLTISAEEFAQKWNFDPIMGVPLAPGRFQWKPVTPAPVDLLPTAAPSAQPDVTTSKTWSGDLGSTSDLPHPADDNGKDQVTCATLTFPPSSAPGHEVTQGQQPAGASGSANLQSKSEVATVRSSSGSDLPSSSAKPCACPASSEKDAPMDRPSSEAVKTEADSGIDSDESVTDEQESSSSLQKNDGSLINNLRQTQITEFVRPRKLATFKMTEPHAGGVSKKRPASSLQDHQLNQPPHKKVLLHLRA